VLALAERVPLIYRLPRVAAHIDNEKTSPNEILNLSESQRYISTVTTASILLLREDITIAPVEPPDK
jgi:hypothetical protein